VLPVLLILIIAISGYTEIVEEIAKVLVILYLILRLPSIGSRVIAGVIFGLLFGVSENMFYLNNFFQLGDFSMFWQRFILTVPMHIVTVSIMIFASATKKRFLILGFASAVATHRLFNSWVVTIIN